MGPRCCDDDITLLSYSFRGLHVMLHKVCLVYAYIFDITFNKIRNDFI